MVLIRATGVIIDLSYTIFVLNRNYTKNHKTGHLSDYTTPCMLTTRDIFRESKGHDSSPQLTMICNLLPTAFELSCVLQLGLVSVKRCGVCNPYIGVYFLFDFRSMTVRKILSWQAQGLPSIEFRGISKHILQFDFPARY